MDADSAPSITPYILNHLLDSTYLSEYIAEMLISKDVMMALGLTSSVIDIVRRFNQQPILNYSTI